jgi:hypothetical protein
MKNQLVILCILITILTITANRYRCPNDVFIYNYQTVLNYAKKGDKEPTKTTFQAVVEVTCALAYTKKKVDYLKIVAKFLKINQIQNNQKVPIKHGLNSFTFFKLSMNGEVSDIWYSKEDNQNILTMKKVIFKSN